MSKIEIPKAAEILKKNLPDDPATVRRCIEEMNLAVEPEGDEGETPPAIKKQFVVLVSDPEGRMPKTDLVAWVLQIPDSESPATTQDRIFRAAYEFNVTKKGRLLPVKTVGEAIENVPAINSIKHENKRFRPNPAPTPALHPPEAGNGRDGRENRPAVPFGNASRNRFYDWSLDMSTEPTPRTDEMMREARSVSWQSSYGLAVALSRTLERETAALREQLARSEAQVKEQAKIADDAVAGHGLVWNALRSAVSALEWLGAPNILHLAPEVTRAKDAILCTPKWSTDWAILPRLELEKLRSADSALRERSVLLEQAEARVKELEAALAALRGTFGGGRLSTALALADKTLAIRAAGRSAARTDAEKEAK